MDNGHDIRIKFNLVPQKVYLWFVRVFLFLLLANVTVIVASFYSSQGDIAKLRYLFDFDFERNVPTIFSCLTLLFSSVLLTFITALHKKRQTSYSAWLGLAIIFLFLSIDEILSIHEAIGAQLRDRLHTTGIWYNAWYIPYGIALIMFVATYAKFLLHLPQQTIIFFVGSGAMYVAGAVGFDALGGKHQELYGWQNMRYSLMSTCEESLEMLGVIIFVYGLLTYIASQFEMIVIEISVQSFTK